MSEPRYVYMNPMQQRIYRVGARDLRVLGSRRFGKTDGVINNINQSAMHRRIPKRKNYG